ncbi:unnamed protein product, partial [Iphiclides podalirius]
MQPLMKPASPHLSVRPSGGPPAPVRLTKILKLEILETKQAAAEARHDACNADISIATSKKEHGRSPPVPRSGTGSARIREANEERRR